MMHFRDLEPRVIHHTIERISSSSMTAEVVLHWESMVLFPAHRVRLDTRGGRSCYAGSNMFSASLRWREALHDKSQRSVNNGNQRYVNNNGHQSCVSCLTWRNKCTPRRELVAPGECGYLGHVVPWHLRERCLSVHCTRARAPLVNGNFAVDPAERDLGTEVPRPPAVEPDLPPGWYGPTTSTSKKTLTLCPDCCPPGRRTCGMT